MHYTALRKTEHGQLVCDLSSSASYLCLATFVPVHTQ